MQGQSVFKSPSLFKLTPYIAEDGMLWIKRRLHFPNSSFDAKHYILLPKCYLAILYFRISTCAAEKCSGIKEDHCFNEVLFD